MPLVKRMLCWPSTSSECPCTCKPIAGDQDEITDPDRDGMHLNSIGYRLLWTAMSKLIQERFKGRGLDHDDLDDLPLRAPM